MKRRSAPSASRSARGSAARGSAAGPGDAAARIYAVVRSIPRGRVATYGEIAGLAGIPSGHRIAARAMRSCPESLPWQRVVGKKDARRGKINIDEPDHAALQRALLEREGVVFDENGFISLKHSGWVPNVVGSASKKRAAKRAPARSPAAARKRGPVTKSRAGARRTRRRATK